MISTTLSTFLWEETACSTQKNPELSALIDLLFSIKDASHVRWEDQTVLLLNEPRLYIYLKKSLIMYEENLKEITTVLQIYMRHYINLSLDILGCFLGF